MNNQIFKMMMEKKLHEEILPFLDSLRDFFTKIDQTFLSTKMDSQLLSVLSSYYAAYVRSLEYMNLVDPGKRDDLSKYEGLGLLFNSLHNPCRLIIVSGVITNFNLTQHGRFNDPSPLSTNHLALMSMSSLITIIKEIEEAISQETSLALTSPNSFVREFHLLWKKISEDREEYYKLLDVYREGFIQTPSQSWFNIRV
jgi:hypothetical protein